MKTSTGITVGIAILGVIALAAPAVPAIANTPQVTSECDWGSGSDYDELDELQGWNVEAGIDTSTNIALGWKWRNCEIWDSMLGGEPDSTDDIIIAGLPATVAIYPDGSRAVVGAVSTDDAAPSSQPLTTDAIVEALKPQPDGAQQRAGTIFGRVSDCSGQGDAVTAVLVNCYVFYSTGITTMSFRADYTLRANSLSTIDWVGDEAKAVLGAEPGNEELETVRADSSNGVPAEARYRVGVNFSVGPLPLAFDVILKLKVIWPSPTVEIN